MRDFKELASINLIKAAAWAAHHEYVREMQRKPEERKTVKAEYINRGKANNGQAIND